MAKLFGKDFVHIFSYIVSNFSPTFRCAYTFIKNCIKLQQISEFSASLFPNMRAGFKIYVLFFDNHHVPAYEGVAGAIS